MNECKNAVVEHVKVIALYPFRHLGCASVVFNLLDAHDFTENEVCEGAHAHVAPSLAVIMVFALHKGLGLRGNLFVLQNGFLRLHGVLQASWFSDLNDSHNAIIDNGLKGVFKAFAYQILPRFLNGADALCLDKELVC